MKEVSIKQDVVTDYWVVYVDGVEVTRAKTLGRCVKSLAKYVKGQEC